MRSTGRSRSGESLPMMDPCQLPERYARNPDGLNFARSEGPYWPEQLNHSRIDNGAEIKQRCQFRSLLFVFFKKINTIQKEIRLDLGFTFFSRHRVDRTVQIPPYMIPTLEMKSPPPPWSHHIIISSGGRQKCVE